MSAALGTTRSTTHRLAAALVAGESLETLLGFAGGPSTLADARRIILYRLSVLDLVEESVRRR